MHKFDIRTARYIVVIIGICLVFMLVIAHAYSYLPANTNYQKLSEKTTPLPTDDIDVTSNSDVETTEDIENNKSSDLESGVEESATNSLITKNDNYASLPPVSKPVANTDLITDIPVEESADNENDLIKTIQSAKMFVSQKQYVEALKEYNNALALTEDANVKADCYEGIALINAITKRYGTALVNAQKAYQLSPTANRELLIARLFYKVGQFDKANERVSRIMNKDIVFDK